MPTGFAPYSYSHAELDCTNTYLLPALRRILNEHARPGARVFDLGCGNGATANEISKWGYDASGVDSSESGIAQAARAFPHLRLSVASAYDDLQSRFGQFPVVVSLEVIEHLYSPRKFAETVFSLLEPRGIAVISTPYHGYWKNLALSLMNKWDHHHTPLWENGHIKFFSIPTLQSLLIESGFTEIRFLRLGRIPPFAKSMVAVARRT